MPQEQEDAQKRQNGRCGLFGRQPSKSPEIVRHCVEREFKANTWEPSPPETAETLAVFDVAENRFDGGLSSLVDLLRLGMTHHLAQCIFGVVGVYGAMLVISFVVIFYLENLNRVYRNSFKIQGISNRRPKMKSF